MYTYTTYVYMSSFCLSTCVPVLLLPSVAFTLFSHNACCQSALHVYRSANICGGEYLHLYLFLRSTSKNKQILFVQDHCWAGRHPLTCIHMTYIHSDHIFTSPHILLCDHSGHIFASLRVSYAFTQVSVRFAELNTAEAEGMAPPQ